MLFTPDLSFGIRALTNAVTQIGKDLEAIGGRGKESISVRLEEDGKQIGEPNLGQ